MSISETFGKPEKIEDMIEENKTEPDRWGITIPFNSIKKEYKNTFYLEYFRLRVEGKAVQEDVPLLEEESVDANRRIMGGKQPREKVKMYIRKASDSQNFDSSYGR